MSGKADESVLRRAAVMWAFVVQRQAERVHEAVGELHAAREDQVFLDRKEAGELPEGWQNYVKDQVGEGMRWHVAWSAGAEQYFFLLAAAQLLKCVEALKRDGLPKIPDNSKIVKTLRNFTEHWEDPQGRSATKLRGLFPDAMPGQLSFDKRDVRFQDVSMYAIVEWALDVDRVLRENTAWTGEVLPGADDVALEVWPQG